MCCDLNQLNAQETDRPILCHASLQGGFLHFFVLLHAETLCRKFQQPACSGVLEHTLVELTLLLPAGRQTAQAH